MNPHQIQTRTGDAGILVIESCEISEGDIVACWKGELRAKDVADRMGVSVAWVSPRIRRNSRLVTGTCSECGGEIFKRFGRHYQDDDQHWQCERAIKDRRSTADRAIQDAAAEASIERSRELCLGTALNDLGKLESRFLSTLIHRGVDAASRACGISLKQASAIIGQMADRGIVHVRPYDGAVFVWDGAANLLDDHGLDILPLSVIPTPPAKAVYARLKSRHEIVFPEIPLCCIVPHAAVSDLLTDWRRSYYLTCRLDFVVCGEDFVPLFAVEYQGGHHEAKDQREKDRFKRTCLEAVGVPLYEIAAGQLHRLDEISTQRVDSHEDES